MYIDWIWNDCNLHKLFSFGYKRGETTQRKRIPSFFPFPSSHSVTSVTPTLLEKENPTNDNPLLILVSPPLLSLPSLPAPKGESILIVMATVSYQTPPPNIIYAPQQSQQQPGTLTPGQIITLNSHTVTVERYLSQGQWPHPVICV